MQAIEYPTTTQPRYNFPLACASLIMAYAVGTGGYITHDYFVEKGITGYSIFETNVDNDRILEEESVRDGQADLQLAKDFLRPSIASLAKAFGVSRQAIYDWQKGKTISAVNRKYITCLAEACELLAQANIGQGQELLRRKISNGKNLIELITSGASAQKSANDLINIIQIENEQRKIVSQKLAGREKNKNYVDAGLPHLEEESLVKKG